MHKEIDWLTIVLSDTQGGGSEHQQIQLFSHLTTKKYRCVVICLTKKDMGCWEFLEQAGKVIYFPFPIRFIKINYLLLFPYLFFFFLTHKVSYTFTTQTLINSSLGIFKTLGFLRKTKVIVRESNSIFELFEGRKLKRYKMAYSLGYRNVDLIICQTNYMKEGMLKSLSWLDKKKVVVIPNPINLDNINNQDAQIDETIKEQNYVVAAGRLADAKGFDILLKSFKALSENWPNLSLLILGDGPLKEDLLELSLSLNLGHKVKFMGFVSNVYPYFNRAKLCVVSSRIEGFPNVLLQMMSQNSKIVSTLCAGGIDEIPGIYTTQTNNADLLVAAMIKALENDTSANREIFNTFLQQRSISNFLSQIMANLK